MGAINKIAKVILAFAMTNIYNALIIESILAFARSI